MLPRILSSLLLLTATAFGQKLLVDRGPFQAGTSLSGKFVGLKDQGQGYLTDTFKIGKAGEVVVIDRIRVWGATEPRADTRDFEDVFDSLALYGGIAPRAEASDKGGECACHGPVRLKGANFTHSPHPRGDSDVLISRVETGPMWQIDFQNLRWSVPGGVDIQFGVVAVGRKITGQGPNFVWKNYAARSGSARAMTVFSEAGKQVRVYSEGGSAQLYIQVWGHLAANVDVERIGDDFQVILHSGPGLDLAQVDADSFRFGPSRARPARAPRIRTDQGGEPVLVMNFPNPSTGILAGTASACLDGQLRDGSPFEGCDLIKKAAAQ